MTGAPKTIVWQAVGATWRRGCSGGLRMLAAAATLLAVTSGGADAADAAAQVLTGTQATFSLTSALLADTPVRVENVPEDGRELALLNDYISRRMDRLAPTFAAATAVVSLTNALPGDPLYRFAREANIRVVDIEAAVPFSTSKPGVALAETPVTDVDWAGNPDAAATGPAPYLWLSVSNAIRMTDIIAQDLSELFPDSSATIERNLEALKQSLLAMRNEYQQRLIESGNDVVFALTPDFVYLTGDMGLFVDGYFVKQDVRWTAEDLVNLTRHLRERDIRVVIHKWMPSEQIQAAIDAAGARLVVLDTADPGIVVDDALAVDGLQRILRKDLEALYQALSGEPSPVAP